MFRLNQFQEKILDDCLQKERGGLSLPLGSGKTILGYYVALKQRKKYDKRPILIVTPKSLISQWIDEFEKFFKDTSKIEVVHNEYMNVKELKIRDDKIIYLTTYEVLSKAYKENGISKYLITKEKSVTIYKPQEFPYIKCKKGLGILFSIKFSSLIVDEADNILNITTQKCRSIVSVCSNGKWLLSGTLFSEPKIERIFGFHMLLHISVYPDNNGWENNRSSYYQIRRNYKGISQYLVHRDENPFFKKTKLNIYFVEHTLNEDETKVYTIFEKLFVEIAKKVFKMKGNKEKRLNGDLLACIIYLRQAVIFPSIPLSSNSKNKLFKRVLKENNLDNFLNDEERVFSSRCKETIKIIKKFPENKIILYSNFNRTLLMCEYYFKIHLPYLKLLKIDSKMSIDERNEVIEKAKKIKDPVLLLTTLDVSGKGFNLQEFNVVIFLDFWWNTGKHDQGLGRVYRMGQTKDVFVYYISSNTKIENYIFKKQKSKKDCSQDLMNGKLSIKSEIIQMLEIFKFIANGENKKLSEEIYSFEVP